METDDPTSPPRSNDSKSCFKVYKRKRVHRFDESSNKTGKGLVGKNKTSKGQDGVKVQHAKVCQAECYVPTPSTSLEDGVPNQNQNALQQVEVSPYLLQIPQLLFQDLLQFELERIIKEREKNTTTHEAMKLQMRCDCQQEMNQIRSKYEDKIRELDVGFSAKEKELDANQQKVLLNKYLAYAMRSQMSQW